MRILDHTRTAGDPPPTNPGARIAVVTPTVAARDHTREATLTQWAALGHEPIVIRQDPAVPSGHRAQRDTARTAIRAGLETGADVIVYAEDDIDLDLRVRAVLPAAASDAGPCSLWHRLRFRPARAVPARGDVMIVHARGAARWWGAQCVVLTRPLAERLLTVDYGRGGIDMDLRLLPPMRITVPPLVSHRPGPRVATRGAHIDHQEPTCPA